jgi:hypothetical protein
VDGLKTFKTVKPLPDEVEEENQQLEQQWKSYDMECMEDMGYDLMMDGNVRSITRTEEKRICESINVVVDLLLISDYAQCGYNQCRFVVKFAHAIRWATFKICKRTIKWIGIYY